MFVVAVLVFQMFTSAPGPQPIPSSFAPDNSIAIQGRIDGHDEWFLLDTGANGVWIDKNDARSFGILGADGAIDHADLSFGGVRAADIQVGVLPNDRTMVGNVEVHGIIGTPLLESGAVTLDYGARRVTFFAPGSFDPAGAGIRSPIDFDGHLTRIHAWFGATRTTLLLDTGDANTLIFQPLANQLVLGAPIGPPYSVRIGSGMPATTEFPYMAEPMTFGGVKILRMRVFAVDKPPVILPSERYDGILGRDILSLFRVTLDEVHNVAYFARV